MPSEKLLACRRVEGGPEPAVPSQRGLCSECAEPIWIAKSSPKDVKEICLQCFEKLDPKEVEFAGLTPEQEEEINAFSLVNKGDLDDIEGLPPVIERLCNSLRELRRDNPKSFFGHPVEGLYDSLEAALADFYRAKVESTSPPHPSDPGAI